MTTPPIMTINDEFLAELEAAADAATAGKWCTDGGRQVMSAESDQLNSGFVIVDCQGPDNLKNAAFVATANPATILALLQHVRELTADANKFREIVCAVVREIPHRDTSRGNAPGHGHSIAGVWDEDNGALAGTECAWCKTWHSAVDAARSSAD